MPVNLQERVLSDSPGGPSRASARMAVDKHRQRSDLQLIHLAPWVTPAPSEWCAGMSETIPDSDCDDSHGGQPRWPRSVKREDAADGRLQSLRRQAQAQVGRLRPRPPPVEATPLRAGPAPPPAPLRLRLRLRLLTTPLVEWQVGLLLATHAGGARLPTLGDHPDVAERITQPARSVPVVVVGHREHHLRAALLHPPRGRIDVGHQQADDR